MIGFVIYPVLRDIKNSSDEILSNRIKSISINSQNNQLSDFKKKYDTYKYNLEKINKLFVDSKDPINFIKFLEKSANDAGVDMDTKLDVLLPTEELNNLPIVVSSISVTGEFLNVLSFFEKLDTSPYLIKIKKVTIKKSSQKLMVDSNLIIEAAAK